MVFPADKIFDIEGFLCACLRGEQPAWPFGQDPAAIAAFQERAEYHGVLALLHDRLQREPESGDGWPVAAVQSIRQSALAQAMWELRHRALLTEAFGRLAAADIIPVVFKGTALAYTLYPEGALRSRGDTDFIIPPSSGRKTAEILAGLGFAREPGISGESVSYEASFTRNESGSGPHTLDVHWRINNSELLSKLFTHEELLAHAQPMPQLGPHARAAGPVHALLIACMHRATHKHNPYYVNGVAYYSVDRLIWLYDIHLLADTFTSEQWIEFVHRAEQKSLCAVCLEGFERAGLCFQTAIPSMVKALLARPGGSEKVARYFAGSLLRQQWMDFCAIPGITCGPDVFCLKLINIAFFALFLAVWFLFLKKRLSRLDAHLLLAVFAVNPVLLEFSNNVLSDLPFLFLSMTIVLLIDAVVAGTRGSSHPRWWGVALGAMIFVASTVRTIGLLFVPTLIVTHAILLLRLSQPTASKERFLPVAIIPYAVFGLLILTLILVLPIGEGSHVEHLISLTPRVLL